MAGKAPKETAYQHRAVPAGSYAWATAPRRVGGACRRRSLRPGRTEIFKADAIDGEWPRRADARSRVGAAFLDEYIDPVLAERRVRRPEAVPYQWYGKQGVHSEHLSHLLTEMQPACSRYPGVQW